ncbi:MAG TPA: DNA repair protein RecO [Pyrinomonadaceae bacterium]|nr:DNA repair protein RecO [Pyrinomonadaceae bacterium]
MFETESLVLKSYNLAESDKIVVLLTRDHGVVRGVAKGAKRLKSKFGSALEPFSLVLAEYFQKDSSELVAIQKADLITSNFRAAGNPDFLQKFSYLIEVLIAFSPPNDPDETLYRMVRACVETATADVESLKATGVYFELWLLRLAGYLPDWTRCDRCGREFDETERAGVRENFHLVCLPCSRTAANRMLSGNGRVIAAGARRLAPDEFAAFCIGSHADLDELSIILKTLISRSIGRETIGEKSLAIR